MSDVPKLIYKEAITTQDMVRWAEHGAEMPLGLTIGKVAAPEWEAPYGMWKADVYQMPNQAHIMTVAGCRLTQHGRQYEVGVRWKVEQVHLRQFVPAIYGVMFTMMHDFFRRFPKAILQSHVRMDRPTHIAFAQRIGFQPVEYFYGQPIDGEKVDLVRMVLPPA